MKIAYPNEPVMNLELCLEFGVTRVSLYWLDRLHGVTKTAFASTVNQIYMFYLGRNLRHKMPALLREYDVR